MKWKPYLTGSSAMKWRFRNGWWASLSRRGRCMKRYLSHATTPERASRRPGSQRFAGV